MVDSQIASIKDRFPKGIAQPALRALFRAGFKKLEELTKISQEEFLSMNGVGPKAVRSIREGLVAKGLNDILFNGPMNWWFSPYQSFNNQHCRELL